MNDAGSNTHETEFCYDDLWGKSQSAFMLQIAVGNASGCNKVLLITSLTALACQPSWQNRTLIAAVLSTGWFGSFLLWGVNSIAPAAVPYYKSMNLLLFRHLWRIQLLKRRCYCHATVLAHKLIYCVYMTKKCLISIV